jgi:hypothetical protein
MPRVRFSAREHCSPSLLNTVNAYRRSHLVTIVQSTVPRYISLSRESAHKSLTSWQVHFPAPIFVSRRSDGKRIRRVLRAAKKVPVSHLGLGLGSLSVAPPRYKYHPSPETITNFPEYRTESDVDVSDVLRAAKKVPVSHLGLGLGSGLAMT